MDQWNDAGEGGYFHGDEGTPAKSRKASAARQQFLCPVTVRQVLESPEEGLKIGTLTANTVSLLGVVSDIETSSTNIKFTLTDDTGLIDCLEWLETEENEKPKVTSNLVENKYFRVYGCIKSPQGRPRIMVFRTAPVKNFNEVTVFLLEVLSVDEYGHKNSKIPKQSTSIASDHNTYNALNASALDDSKAAFSPAQRAVLEAIKSSGTKVGWSKYDPEIRKKFSAKQIEAALDFLVSEGHTYTTVDDDHYCST